MAKLTFLAPRLATLDSRTSQPPPKRADAFYLTPEWRKLVAEVVRERGRRCELCGRSDGRMFVDHIRELQDGGAPFAKANLQILDGKCHTLKTVAERAKRMARRY